MALVLIDDGDLLARPTQIESALNQIILASLAGGVVAHLCQSGLTNVNESPSFQMIRKDLGIVESVEHIDSPWQANQIGLRYS